MLNNNVVILYLTYIIRTLFSNVMLVEIVKKYDNIKLFLAKQLDG